MPIIIKWLLFILIAAFSFSIFLWIRTRKASRFQGRLTLFFFLFVIIPLAPLTLFLGQLLMKSAETFMLPGVEQSLTQSLDVFRKLLNDRGRLFLQTHTNIPAVTPEMLKKANVLYAGEIVFASGKAKLQTFVGSEPGLYIPESRFVDISPEDALQRTQSGELFVYKERRLFESWAGDSSFAFVGFEIPGYVVQTKEKVATALSNYTTLALLGETMVQGNVIWFVLIAFILFIAIVSALLARAVSAGISGPIRKLTEGMHKIGDGDLSYRVRVKAKDEVAYLVESFNRMAEELKKSRESLQRAERAAAWRDVARQVSHEIKNPLTPIEFSIYRLESSVPSEWLDNSDLRESLKIIKEEISSIRRIANTFSQFARMPHTELKPADVGEIVRESVELFRNKAPDMQISFEQAGDLPLVPIDAQQIKGVVHNLIKNAIEASKAGDEIKVKATTDSEPYKVQISVTDHGCGMDEETAKRIFDPYFTTKEDGSGIGLFLAQRIIADHGGDISVESRPGEGARFTIRI